MSHFMLRLSRRLWPDIEELPAELLGVGVANVITTLLFVPLALAGLIWLAISTDLAILQRNAPMLTLLLVLMYLFDRTSYYLVIETAAGRSANAEGSLDAILFWAGVLLYGPSAIWSSLLLNLLAFISNQSTITSTAEAWNNRRNLLQSIAGFSLGSLAALQVYAALGGQHPLPGLALPDVVRAMAATAVLAASTIPLWSTFVGILYFTRDLMGGASWLGAFWRLMLTSIGLPNLISPFGILVAGVFAQNGIVAFSFTVVGLFLVAYLARKLSFEAESSRQRSRQLDQLERLGEAIINSPPNASQLPGILSEYVPSMFNGRIHIWVNSSQVLLHHPAEWTFDHQAAAAWVEKQLSAQAILARQPLPWDSSQSAQRGTIVAPIHDPESSRPIGGIYLDMRSPIRQMDLASLESAYPAIHTLASQIASALKQAEKYAQTLDYQRMAQELSLAGRIQASFLPNRMPDLPGWQLAVTLLPARATSGDFFDFIALPDGSLGILIADVADKGIGPALYMALSRTLIRTYAIEYQANPGTVFQLANRRILSDARANLFITVFFGVLNPLTGELRYCNAGHNPPFLIGLQSGGSLTMLDKTGIPIGIDADAAWNENSVSIQPGDVLVLYTDGVTEAENEDGDFFDEDYLMEVASLNLGRPAYEIQGAILEEVQAFVGHHPQSDDITLMILQRDFTA